MKKFACVLAVAFWALGIFAQQQVKKTFSDVTSVEVEGLFCNVTIEAMAGDNVEFDGRVSSKEPVEDLKILFNQTGTNLKVWVDSPKKWNNSFQGSLMFKVPRNTNVNVSNVSGNVMAKGLSGSVLVFKSISGDVQSNGISSNLKAETVSGNVLVNIVDGNLHASSVSGNVEVNQVGGSLNASTISGRLMVKKVQGQTKASSVSGSLEVLDINSNLSVNTTSGGIVVGGVKGDVDCNSTSGQIKLSHVNGSIKAKTVSGNINGDNILLTGQSVFNSMSGSIDMSFTNAADGLSFDIKSFSGRLSARGVIGKEKLYIDKGNVWVKGETFSGSQTYL